MKSDGTEHFRSRSMAFAALDDVAHWLYDHHMCTQLFVWRFCQWSEGGRAFRAPKR